jgi:hypothetical protein
LYLKEQLAEQGMPPTECSRLRAVPDTLSQWDGMKDLDLDDFRAAPHLQRWEKVPIVKRALRALLVAGLDPDVCEGRDIPENSAKYIAFRKMLYLPQE